MTGSVPEYGAVLCYGTEAEEILRGISWAAGLPAYSPIVVSCTAKDTWKFPLLPSLVPTGRRWQVEEKSTKK